MKENANAAIKALKDYLQAEGIEYRSDKDNECFVSLRGEVFPVAILFTEHSEARQIQAYCRLPFAVKRTPKILWLINRINRETAYGKFCLYEDGLCTYEDCESFAGAEIITPLYGKTLIAAAYATVEKYIGEIYSATKE